MSVDDAPTGLESRSVSHGLRRVIFTFGFQIYNQIVTIAVQLLLVPVLLHAWGTETYGVWLVLSAVPNYLTLSDFGFTAVAKNEMTMLVARGNRRQALVLYQSILSLLHFLASGLTLLIVGAVFWVRLGSIWSLGPISENSAKGVLVLLSANVILYQYFLLGAAGIRCEGRPAAEVAWGATARLAEGIATVTAASLGGDVLLAAWAIIANRILFNAAMLCWLRRLAPWLRLGGREATLSEIRRLFNPSVSYMFVSIGQAVMIQGPIVLLGVVANPVQVVIFSTSRTLARLGTSAANILNFSVWPEYSRLYGAGEIVKFRRLVALNVLLCLLIIFGFLSALYLVAPTILYYWTAGRVTVEQPFFFLLMLSIAAEISWSTLFVPLAAINGHMTTSYAFAIVSSLSLLAFYLGAPTGSLVIVAVVLLIAHTIMIVITAVEFRRGMPTKMEALPRLPTVRAE